MKTFFAVGLVLAGLSLYTVKADERVLVVPQQPYSDGRVYSEFIRYFRDDHRNTAHAQCADYARWLHTSRISAPHFTACISPAELMELRRP